jgi:hypothetical protein
MKISKGNGITTLTMRTPDNWHAHFRQGLLCRFLVQQCINAGWRGRSHAGKKRRGKVKCRKKCPAGMTKVCVGGFRKKGGHRKGRVCRKYVCRK